MTDDIENVENVKPTISPEEATARANGWLPKDEFHGDEGKWVDAAEFNRRAPLFEKITAQNKKLKQMEESVAQLIKHHQAVRETEYKRALESLKANKIAAYNEGDPEKVIQIEEDMEALKEQQRIAKQEEQARIQKEAAQMPQEFVAWVSKNSWYQTDEVLHDFADAVGKRLIASGGLTEKEVLQKVEERVRKEFPHKFTNPNRTKPGAVEGTSSSGQTKSTKYSPSPQERRIAADFVRQGLFKSEDEYYRELAEINKSKK